MGGCTSKKNVVVGRNISECNSKENATGDQDIVDCNSKEKVVGSLNLQNIFVGNDYILTGKLDEDCAEAVAGDLEWTGTLTKENFTQDKLEEMRGMGEEMMAMFQDPAYTPFMKGADVEEIKEMGGPKYHEKALPCNVFIHRKKGAAAGNKPALVYFHGGGAIMGDAKTYQPVMNRITMDSDITVFNCNYGLAPERPAPGGIQDAYAILKDILANAQLHGIDESRVCIAGESSGGYIVAGIALMLALNNESHLIKFQFQMIPMVDDLFMKEEEGKNKYEKAYWGFMQAVDGFLKTGEQYGEDYWIYPNNAPDSLIEKCPPALILTCEFDMYRRGSENAAKLYRKNGKLLEIGIMAGTHHGFYFDFNASRTPAWFKAIKDAVDVYLKL